MGFTETDEGIGFPTRGYCLPEKGSLQVGMLPERRSPALYVVRDGEITAIAYFRSPWEVEEVVRMLDAIASKYGCASDHDRTEPEGD